MMVLESPLRLYTAAGLFPPHSIFPAAAHRFGLGHFGTGAAAGTAAGFLAGPPHSTPQPPPHLRFRPHESPRRQQRRPQSPQHLTKGQWTWFLLSLEFFNKLIGWIFKILFGHLIDLFFSSLFTYKQNLQSMKL